MDTIKVYSPYGYQSTKTVPAGALGFNGQLFQAVLEGYALGNGHRIYNPRLMRFVSADALSPFGKGGINAYAYCLNDPVNGRDPTGKSIFRNAGKRVSALAQQAASYLKVLSQDNGLTNNQNWNMGPEMNYMKGQERKAATLIRVIKSQNGIKQLEPELSHKVVVTIDGTVVVGSSINDLHAPSHATLAESRGRGHGAKALFAGYLIPTPTPIRNPNAKVRVAATNHSGHYQTRPRDFVHLDTILEEYDVEVDHIEAFGS